MDHFFILTNKYFGKRKRAEECDEESNENDINVHRHHVSTHVMPFPVLPAKLVLNMSGPRVYSLLNESTLIFVPERLKCRSPRELNEAFPFK